MDKMDKTVRQQKKTVSTSSHKNFKFNSLTFALVKLGFYIAELILFNVTIQKTFIILI